MAANDPDRTDRLVTAFNPNDSDNGGSADERASPANQNVLNQNAYSRVEKDAAINKPGMGGGEGADIGNVGVMKRATGDPNPDMDEAVEDEYHSDTRGGAAGERNGVSATRPPGGGDSVGTGGAASVGGASVGHLDTAATGVGGGGGDRLDTGSGTGVGGSSEAR